MDNPCEERREDLADFKHYTDYYLSVWNLVSNISTGLSDKSQIHAFIYVYLCGDWLFECIQYEQQNLQHAQTYKANQLIITLQQKLKYVSKRSYTNQYNYCMSTPTVSINQACFDNDNSDEDIDYNPNRNCSSDPFTKKLFD